jgi:heme-degrading monooxygenase HmoA
VASVVFVNCFEVPDGRDDAFSKLWTDVNDYMRRQPGYLGHRLVRALTADSRYRFVNVAEWASAEDCAAAHGEEFRELVANPAWAEFTSVPALFETIHEHHVSHE